LEVTAIADGDTIAYLFAARNTILGPRGAETGTLPDQAHTHRYTTHTHKGRYKTRHRWSPLEMKSVAMPFKPSLGPLSEQSLNRLFKYNHLPMSSSSWSASFKHLIISLYIDLASSGGTAFPIWRRALVLESAEKVCDIGNVCKLADSLIV
jgi:hypothetical protein